MTELLKPEGWEKVCEMCGQCCLVKYADKEGNVYLTDIMCDNMDRETGKCKCYDPDVARRGSNVGGCAAHKGAVLNLDTLRNDYLVPGCCPYVKKYVCPNRLQRPKIDYSKCVYEHEVCDANGDIPLDVLQRHAVPSTWRLFKYNSHVNARIRALIGCKVK